MGWEAITWRLASQFRVFRLPREMSERSSWLSSVDGSSHQSGTESAVARDVDEGIWLEDTSPGSKPSWRRILHAGYCGAREWNESGRPRHEMEWRMWEHMILELELGKRGLGLYARLTLLWGPLTRLCEKEWSPLSSLFYFLNETLNGTYGAFSVLNRRLYRHSFCLNRHF